MRHISFALTTQQVRERQKTVTRRTGWAWLQPGTLLQPVVKAQGLKKGERVEKIGGPIRVVEVTREHLLDGLCEADLAREGFPGMSPRDFVAMFCQHNGCQPDAVVTRIAFEYTEAQP